MCFLMSIFGGKRKKDLEERVGDLESRLDGIAGIVTTHSNQIGEMMATLDEVQAKVAEQDATLDDIRAKVTTQAAQIAELQAVISGGGLSTENQAKVDAIMASLTKNSAEMQEALGNAPAEPQQ